MILPTSINATGSVTFSGNAATSFNGGQGYEGGKPCGATGTAATDVLVGGFRYTALGVLRTEDATAGLPAGATKLGGFAVASTGHLCTTTNAIDGNSKFIAGIAVDANGAVHIV